MTDRREREETTHSKPHSSAGPGEEHVEYDPIQTECNAADTTDTNGDSESTSGEYVPESNDTKIVAGTLDFENAFFVALGAFAMVAVLLRLVSLGFG